MFWVISAFLCRKRDSYLISYIEKRKIDCEKKNKNLGRRLSIPEQMFLNYTSKHPRISFFSIMPWRNSNTIQRDVYHNVLCSVISSSRNYQHDFQQPNIGSERNWKCLSLGKRLNKMCYIYMMEKCTAIYHNV